MTLHRDTARLHCLSYDVLTTLPAKILDTRDPEHHSIEKDARLVHDALLLKFAAAMPCLRSKQVRDASIHGAAANVFMGQLNANVITVPEWAAEELRRDPTAEFWQVRFSHVETGGSAIHALLPMDVVPLLEEYLSLHRPCLAGYKDSGRLFLNQRGGPLSAGGARDSAISQAMDDLQKAASDAKATPDQLRTKVAVVRAARQKAKAKLEAARKELLTLLSPEQEALLVGLGYLE